MMKVIDTAALILSEKAVRASQFFDNVDVSGLILDTITELERRKLEENSRLYYPPREEQTVPYALCRSLYCPKMVASLKFDT